MAEAAVYAEVARELARARRVLAITGAGISADSGMPTYRGVGGLYDSGPTADGVAIEDALSGDMLSRRPELCWKYLGEIESATRSARPNAGHLALARLAPRYARFTVLTQNVDGFHRAAGSQDLIEIHGNLHRLHCCACPYELEVPDYAGLVIPPSCPYCAGLVRPGVTLFGEALPEPELTRLYALLEEGVDLVLSIGTTSVFPYIAAPMLMAAQRGLPSVEINPGSSEVSHLASYRIRERAAPALEKLLGLVLETAV
jgi:NAD-dependent protein deacetylase/lipoamidase